MFGKIHAITNKTLAHALFTTSIEETRKRLQEDIWFEHELVDTIVHDALKRGDDLVYIREMIVNNSIFNHNRINTVERLASFLHEPHGPTLIEAMTMDMSGMGKLNCNLKAVPLTETEHQMKQMEKARLLFSGQMNVDEEEQEEDVVVEKGEESEQHAGDKMGAWSILWPMKKLKSTIGVSEYSWYRSVWYRVNYAPIFVNREKALSFANAHLPIVQYLDSLDDPRDDLLDLTRLVYVPMRGGGVMNEYVDFSIRKVTWHKINQTPLELLRLRFPHLIWSVEEVLSSSNTLFLDQSYLDDDSWAPIHPEKAPRKTHCIYYACIYIANQCRTLKTDEKALQDALWYYYVSFLDFFSYVALCENPQIEASDSYLLTPVGSYKGISKHEMHYSDRLTPWEMYGSHLDVRTKHAGDLPDIFHLINSIPLGGEQCVPPTKLGKIYQKTFPFACQRRHITPLIIESIQSDDAFWALCSHLFWCMFAGLYPGDSRDALTMRDLMRAKQLTQTKESFIAMIDPNTHHSSPNGGPLVIFTAFRLHIIYMASLNPLYVQCASASIDWDNFVQSTHESAQLIRESDLIPEDPLERARAHMIKLVKNSNGRVARIRRRTLAITLAEKTNDVLEKLIFKDYYTKRKLLQDVRFYEHILSFTCKSAITNMLLRIPPQDRFTYGAYSILTLPEYGAVSLPTIERMFELTTVYFKSKGMPKDYDRVVDQFDTRDFVIACYYLNMASDLERMSFVPLDYETTRRTDEAMISSKRYNLFPGQAIPPNTFNIHIALCCGRVCTLMGQGKFGAKMIAFDMEKQCFVCSRGKNLHKKNKLGADAKECCEKEEDEPQDEEEEEDEEDSDLESEDEEIDIDQARNDHIEEVDDIILGTIDHLVSDAIKQNGRGSKRSIEMTDRKAIRTERKRFNRIPCGQPVITVNLRGRALIWGKTGEKQKQFMFCPSCGAFHVYSILNFSGAVDGLYRCNECAAKESGHVSHNQCAYCTRTVVGETFLDIATLKNPKESTGGRERMYFCKNHYNITKRYYIKCVTKETLWSIIKRVEHKRMMKYINK
jgi:hypothetical protein